MSSNNPETQSIPFQRVPTIMAAKLMKGILADIRGTTFDAENDLLLGPEAVLESLKFFLDHPMVPYPPRKDPE